MRPTLLVLLFVLSSSAVFGQTLRPTTPEEVGLSTQGLARIDTAMQRYVDDGTTPGLLTLIARKGKVVHVGRYGWMDREAQKPMRDDTIFRLHSMTKPITSVALLMLYERGLVDLDAPVSAYLPAFADQRVYTGHQDDQPQSVAPERPATIRDMMMHTSGLIDPATVSEDLAALYRSGLNQDIESLQELASTLGTLPLGHQPGARWSYGYSTDVVAAIVETVSGLSYRDFLQQEIFLPLRMHDTDFHVPPAALDRLSAKYIHTAADGVPRGVHPTGGETLTQLFESPTESPFTKPPRLYRGATGLVSTAPDYLRFAQMLLNGGTLDGVRLLRPETVTLLATHQAPEAVLPLQIGTFPFPGPGHGFGLGVAVVQEPKQAHFGRALSPGSYWWVGAANTYFWIDPEEEIVGLLMTQIADLGLHEFIIDFQALVYESLQEVPGAPGDMK